MSYLLLFFKVTHSKMRDDRSLPFSLPRFFVVVIQRLYFCFLIYLSLFVCFLDTRGFRLFNLSSTTVEMGLIDITPIWGILSNRKGQD